ncbi:asparagine synthase-related protein [Haloglycomyces albus]|uniref:asparagine synthase-related protein n=1 Tax=Haloglycomyces albus TaxID=526067 RepID=UPI0004B4FD8D|nr:asparagine synthase-related protein [Haloglycomyces albus]
MIVVSNAVPLPSRPGDVIARSLAFTVYSHESDNARVVSHGDRMVITWGERPLPSSEVNAIAERRRRAMRCFCDELGSGAVVAIDGGCMSVSVDHLGCSPAFVHTQGDGIIVSSRGRDLARMVNASVNEGWLASWMAAPPLFSPFVSTSPWHDTVRIAPGGWLRWAAGSVTYDITTPDLEGEWSSTDRYTSLAQAVEIPEPRGRVGADLSGGLDSSSVVCLAATNGQRPDVAVTCRDDRSQTDDNDYAIDLAARLELPHEWFVLDTSMDAFSDTNAWWDSDEPWPDAPSARRFQSWFSYLTDLGVRHHLTGAAADCVVTDNPTYLSVLAQQREWAHLWRHCRAWGRLRHRSPMALFARAVTGSRLSLAEAVESSVTAEVGPERWGWDTALDRAAPTVGMRWLSATARQAAIATTRTSLATAVPSDSDISAGVWMGLQSIREYAQGHRAEVELARSHGWELVSPFLDWHVAQRFLTPDTAVRNAVDSQKPLLTEAMRGVLPDRIAQRRTKGHFNTSVYQGLNTGALATIEWLSEGHLAKRDLIDLTAVRDTLDRGRHGFRIPVGGIGRIVAAEAWLRSLDKEGLS